MVSARSTGSPLEDRPIELRVEDHPIPLRELRRLLEIRRAYQHVDVGEQLEIAGDLEGALASSRRRTAPSRTTSSWPSGAGSRSPRTAASRRRRRSCGTVFEAQAGWIELLKRLPASGLFPDDGELIARLVGTRAVSMPAESAATRALARLLAVFHDRAHI